MSKEFESALSTLEKTITSRRNADPNSSYTATLLASGTPKIAQKVGEEAVETVIAAIMKDRDAFIYETADLFFHLLVLCNDRGVALADIATELNRRRKT